MKFIDEIKIEVEAGKGGDGIISFRHEARVEKGGPDGGDGGNGGNIIFCADTGLNTLYHLYNTKIIKGNDGQNGMSKNMYGAKGKDVIIKVPYGTLIYDENENLIADIVENKNYLIAQGGKGGFGNTKFKSSKNTVPKICENGTQGEKFKLNLKLKIISDLGLVGKPNAGKSSFICSISNANSKIGNYEFTTLVPKLGLVRYYNSNFIVLDIPGLILKSSQGKGLGIRFIKHIQRCKALVYVLDFGSEFANPIYDFEILKNELSSYDLKILDKKSLILANKSDLSFFEKNYKIFKKKYPEKLIIKNSITFTKKQVLDVKKALFDLYKDSKIDFYHEEQKEVFITFKDDLSVQKLYEGMYVVSGKKIIDLYNKIPLSTYENVLRFNRKAKRLGLWELLENNGIKKGDTVQIENYQFTWEDEL